MCFCLWLRIAFLSDDFPTTSLPRRRASVVKLQLDKDGVPADHRPLAVLHIGPHKCASSFLQHMMYEMLRDEVESDGFALPLPTDIPGRYHGPKVFANIFGLIHRQLHETASREWTNVTKFFDRAHQAQKRLVISSETFGRTDVPVTVLKTLLAHWSTHVVVIYRPFYDWVVSLHKQRFCRHKISVPLTEWLTFRMMSAIASGTNWTFSVALRNRYQAKGFKVTVLALNSSLVFDFVCGIMGASRTCQKLRDVPRSSDQRVNARKSYPCITKLCLSSKKLDVLLNMSLELDRAVPAEVQRSAPFLLADFGNKTRSQYFCSCAEPPAKKLR